MTIFASIRRKRNYYLYFGAAIVLGLYFLTDPYFGVIQHLPFGGGTIATLLIMLKGLLYVSLLHFSRKYVLDYKEADYRLLLAKAIEQPTGAGLATIGVSLMMVAFAIVIFAATNG